MLDKLKEKLGLAAPRPNEVDAELEALAERIEANALNQTDLPIGAELERVDDVPEDGNPGISFRLG